MCRALTPDMQTNNAAVPSSVRDSPSQRITRPTGVQTDQVDPDDEGDRDDGENWFENNVERGVETVPASKPLIIDDEPTSPHSTQH
jgi:hypothetical protein